MLNKFKKLYKSKSFISTVLIIAIALEVLLSGWLSYKAYYNEGYFISRNITAELLPVADELADAAVEDTAEDEIKKRPPKYSTSGSKTTIETSAGTATAISTGGSISGADADKLAGYADDGPSTITYNDTTGRYPGLGATLISHLNSSLLNSSSDKAYMYEIEIIDCSSCNYGGLYTGSYLQNGSDITTAFGWIKLNSYWYKDSPYFEDYMKLIFSHEYGHHYSLYHRWVDLDIGSDERWPASYYANRPLSLASTAVDYSKGWANCDTEVVAEDYSYFYSGYGQHAMSGTYGYPSAAINTWLHGLSNSVPIDSTPPTVSVTAPANGAEVSGSTAFSANASDNEAVTRVEFFVDDVLINTDSSAPYSYAWGSASVANGSHTLKAKAYDAFQSAESSITVTVNNVGVDAENPTVVINQPATNPYAWSAGDLTVEATGSDNVAVVKTEFYIDGVLAAEDLDSNIIRLWSYAPTPVGSYTLTAKAYDAAGNIGESSIVINKS